MEREWITKRCKYCNREFSRPSWKAKYQKFCSVECANSALLGKKKKKPIIKICPICKKEFTLSCWLSKRRTYCSNTCAGKSRKGKPGYPKAKGKHSSCYRGPIKKHNGVWDYDEKGRFRLIHRILMEKQIKRELKKSEIIHHINGDKFDNRIKNLYLCHNRSEHINVHRLMRKIVSNLIEKEIIEFNDGKYFIK